MGATWSVQDAKNKFSAVVEAARRDGPQTVTKRGAPAVVVVAAEEFERLRKSQPQVRPSFVEQLLAIPKGPPIKRMKVKMRDIEW
ncbi:MAG: type II toxin-antitoxin system prevent-host-death family antitoxin [Alphaproteobacteria bacterium]|nr:type II toxin-antitoxin system prevent-host-death family antitoxin [Alphaproteobacteria bacterium]